VIAAQLYGHDHSGSFRLFYTGGGDADDDGKKQRPSSVAYATPSLTPYKNQLPSFRVYDLDLDQDRSQDSASDGEAELPASSGVVQFKQYYLDLSKYGGSQKAKEAKEEADGPITWFLSFTAPQSLGLPDLAPRSWRFVADKLVSNATIREDFVKLGANGRPMMGSEGSLRTFACGVRHVSSARLFKCSRQNEEQFIRDYTGIQHTYVLTTLFSFDVIFDQFCSSMAGFLPEDCANIL